MNENVIEFLRNQDTATLSLSQGRFISKVKKLAEQYPDECEIIHENKDGSILAHVPVNWIKISKHSGRQLTEEEKKVNGERLALYRKNKQNA